MPKQRGRFDYEQIVRRVEEHRARVGMPAKQLYEAVGLSGDKWYRKVRGQGSTFTLDEFGAIADVLEAPEGWPFVEWRP
jgi:hypothetical protein